VAGQSRENQKKCKKKDSGAPAWMVTYSDMVTLLLTFFVLLLSMANLDKIKFTKAAISLKDAFGVLGGRSHESVSPPAIIDFAPIPDDLIQRVYRRVLTQLNRLKIKEDISLVKDRGAIVLRVNDSVLFDSGQSAVKPQAYPVLREIAALIRSLPLQLRIEGHTDDTPFYGGEMTNWDLSVSRAVSVLKFFEQGKLFPLERMSAVGFGSQRPLDLKGSPEQKALNRRVEFVLESSGSYREELPYLIDVTDQLPF
jgi:chemotaxis protein MotB